MDPSNPYQNQNYAQNYQPVSQYNQPVYNNIQQQQQPGHAYQVYVPTANQNTAYRSFIAPRNNINELEEGCYPCYKVLLSIFLILYIVALMGGLYTAIQDPYLNILLRVVGVVIYLVPVILICIQLQAISDKNASKASTAFCGFIVYILGYMLYVLSVAAYFGNVENVTYFVYKNIILTAAFLTFVVFGSYKVSKILNKAQDS